MEDKVIAKNIGNFGIILTRRYLLYIVMVIAAFLSIYTFVLVEETAHEHRRISALTWEQFREECGYEAFSQNPRRAFRSFEMHHFGKAVGWDGYVVRVNLNDDDPLSISYHSAYIMVKMETADMPGGHGADIGVTLSEHNLEKYSEVIEDLHIGDHIAVNATLLSLGDKHHLHHLRAFNIAKIPGHMDVQAHAHSSGRYKLKLAHNETDQSDVKRT